MKLFHLADGHACPERADEFIQSMNVARDRGEAEGVDLYVFAGDIWDSVIRNTEGSRFPELVEAIRQLADVAPLALIYGTPTHDAAGSLQVFLTLQSQFGITLLHPLLAYVLTAENEIVHSGFDELKSVVNSSAKALLFGVPEPSKKWLAPYFDSKAETEQAVRDGLQKLFAGLGAIRRQYPAIPCVLAYHGQVGGARFGNQLLDTGSGIRPSIDDLAAVGADYIAAGDIHEPQQVGASIGLPFYYSGSVYPCAQDEEHEAGGNLVTIDDGLYEETYEAPGPDGTGGSLPDFKAWVTRVPFGHPVNQTIRANLVPELLGAHDVDVNLSAVVTRGARVRLEVRMTREDNAGFDGSELLARLLAAGADPRSEVKPDPIPVETVRSGDIASKSKLREKVVVWAENSKKEAPESLLAKADEVEAEAERSGAVGSGATIRALMLIVKNAVGLWKKSRLTEIVVDFRKIPQGLVVLVGGNGSGKTTTMENMQYYSSLLTPGRDGPLWKEFRGREGLSDYYFAEEVSGLIYRSKITSDAVAKSCEYYLYSIPNQGDNFDPETSPWQPVTGIDGRQASYDAIIDKLFGTKELFMRSAFVTQRQPKNLPDLGDATVGQRKTLFSMLSGTDYLEVFKAGARSKGDSQEATANTKQNEIDVLTVRLPDELALKLDRDQSALLRSQAQAEMATLKTQGEAKRKEVDTISIAMTANSQKATQADEAGRLAREASGKIATANASKDTAERAIAGKFAAQATLEDFAQLSAQLASQNDAYAKHMEAVAEENRQTDDLRAEYDRQVTAHRMVQDGERAKQREARAEFDRTEQKYRDDFEALRTAHVSKVSGAREAQEAKFKEWQVVRDREINLQHQVENLAKAVEQPIVDTCLTCKQSLPEEASKHVHDERKALLNDLSAKSSSLTETTAAQKALEVEWTNLKLTREAVEKDPPKPQPRPAYIETLTISPDLPPFTPPGSTLPPWNDIPRQAIRDKLMFIDEAAARATVSAAEQAQVRIEELTKQIAEFQATAEREAARERELRAGLDPNIHVVYNTAKGELDAMLDAYREAQRREAQAQAQHDQVTKQLEAIASQLAEIETMRQSVTEIRSQVAEWRLLEFACSDKGIQALELDAFAPTAAAIANKLLRDAFGSRFSLEISTTKLSGSGKAQKQIEVFDIMVHDAETGEAQEIATLSGGEAVWVRRALYDAFGLIRATKTNLRFLTVFQDEADGALDPEAKLTYLRMLQSAHVQAGRAHTIIITHSTDLQELIPSRIEVAKLRGRIAKEAV